MTVQVILSESITTLSGLDWTNQSIQVDVRPLAIEGANRSAGVLVRYIDEGNFYAARLRSTNQIVIVRRTNGAWTVLASAPFAFPLNVTHRIRFEAVGRWLRLYVGGQRVLQARDSKLTHGAVGMRTFWTRAQYDNVVVGDNPAVVMQYDDFQDGTLEDWVGLDWGAPVAVISSTGSNRFLMHSPTFQGESLTLSGGPYNPGYGALWDEVIECRVRPVSYGAAQSAVGLIVRYMNSGTFIYASASAAGQMSLIARTPFGEFVLDSVPARLALNQWSVLRVEATDRQLRVYLNGRFLLQGLDPYPEEMGGRYGMWSKNALVHFDNCLAQLP